MIRMMVSCMASMGLLGMGLTFALLAGVIAAIVYLVRGMGRGERTSSTAHAVVEDRALAVLRERYARGEIDRPEYEERRAARAAGGMDWG